MKSLPVHLVRFGTVWYVSVCVGTFSYVSVRFGTFRYVRMPRRIFRYEAIPTRGRDNSDDVEPERTLAWPWAPFTLGKAILLTTKNRITNGYRHYYGTECLFCVALPTVFVGLK
jgi:hypothetical protein